MKATTGAVALVLHAHLPWVRHPDQPHMMEEEWLYEAITETYLPILEMLERFASRPLRAPLTMSLTPPLCEMLTDDLLKARYEARLDALLELARKELIRHSGTDFEAACKDAIAQLEIRRQTWRRLEGRLIPAFAAHQRAGRLEIITCTATHALIPLLASDQGRRAQLAVACDNYVKHFGRRPRGIWLPECAYAEGMDALVNRHGIEYFITETHAIQLARPRPPFGHYRPIASPGGPIVFGRDPQCSKEVWSAQEGYPGDSAYREFYRDAGWDAPRDQLNGLFGTGPRRNVGLKFHRITGDCALDNKAAYQPGLARERVELHAEDFVTKRRQQVSRLNQEHGFTPLLVAPYDAELFGHWWAEGPQWLEAVMTRLASDPLIELTTPLRYLKTVPSMQVSSPIASTWGRNGDLSVWLEDANRWIYPELHRAEERLAKLVRWHGRAHGLLRRALNQAGRELLLAQSSDWAFIMAMGTTVEYATRRTIQHLANVHELCAAVDMDKVNAERLSTLEATNSLFPELDFRHWGDSSSDASLGPAACTSTPLSLDGTRDVDQASS